MPSLRILILSDGRPGHFNLSEGIAAAIERLGPAQTTRIDVRRGGWSGATLAALTRAHVPAHAMLRAVYGLDAADVPPADVVVSAGAETLAANVWLTRLRRVPGIFYGSLRLFDPRDFALVLTSYTRNAGRPHHAMTLKPSRLDPDTIPPRHPAAVPTTLGLLVGGDAGGITYRPEDWAALAAAVAAMARATGVRWRIANSRRTPDAASDALVALSRDPANGIDEILDVRRAGAGTLPTLLAACDRVVCTADSSSMVSECVWARRPTLAVAPRRFALPGDEQAYRTWLEESGWTRSLPIAALTVDAVTTAFAAVRPLPENPAQKLAELIAERVPEVRRFAVAEAVGPQTTKPAG